MVSNFIVQALLGQHDHHLRRRQPDALLLLCRRPDRRDASKLMASPAEVIGPINIGNTREFTILRTGEDGDRDHRLALEDRQEAAAGRRSEAAPARHHQGAREARQEPKVPAREGRRARSPISAELLADEIGTAGLAV